MTDSYPTQRYHSVGSTAPAQYAIAKPSNRIGTASFFVMGLIGLVFSLPSLQRRSRLAIGDRSSRAVSRRARSGRNSGGPTRLSVTWVFASSLASPFALSGSSCSPRSTRSK